ncbi:hypothetical protein E8L90_12690 [Brevibacillus antibioticus]|uniref:Helix-turn-helix conjugative transposon-like domain-containing protein n=1 Tax=Brevibacillus antibioticus TaxID=2570228 RepID=A0A4U2Y7Q4_9BACL|nr:hypothetical protein [Brevibacillus antibioticus]TKI56254.1 hypothetical protein E8L90_12690 [Brevibacillus antibioticus]
MQKSEPEETAQLSNHAFSLIAEQAKNGDNEALLKVLEEMQPEIDYLAGFLKLPKEEGIQEITTQFIEKIRG